LSDESLFREVDEEVRQEQFKKLWARYGKFVIGLAVLVIIGVAGMEGWRYFQMKQSEQAGDSFFAATDLAAAGKAAERSRTSRPSTRPASPISAGCAPPPSSSPTARLPRP